MRNISCKLEMKINCKCFVLMWKTPNFSMYEHIEKKFLLKVVWDTCDYLSK